MITFDLRLISTCWGEVEDFESVFYVLALQMFQGRADNLNPLAPRLSMPSLVSGLLLPVILVSFVGHV